MSAGRRLWAMLPTAEPTLALRLAFYLAGLLLFGAERLIEYYSLKGVRLSHPPHTGIDSRASSNITASKG